VTSLLDVLTIGWGTTLVALAGLLIYRSLVAMKEANFLSLDPAEWQLEQEQLAILDRLHQIRPIIKSLVWVSIAFLAAIVGILVHRAFGSVPQ
jgi:hypothetical protein